MDTESIPNQGSKRGRVSRPLAGLAYYREYHDQFRSLGAGRYEVPSRTRNGQRHEVNIERETCSCEDATTRGRMCAHIFAVTIAISKPAPIPSRERFQFSPAQVAANVERMAG